MAPKQVSLKNGLIGQSRSVRQDVARLVDSTGNGVSAFYAAIAGLLIGRAEDVVDLRAARRSRRIDRAAAKQAAGGAAIKSRS